METFVGIIAWLFFGAIFTLMLFYLDKDQDELTVVKICFGSLMGLLTGVMLLVLALPSEETLNRVILKKKG